MNLYTAHELDDNPNPSNLMTFESYLISDITVGYTMDNGLDLKLGVDNVFDRELPFGTRGTGGGSASYDNIGRFACLTVSYKL